MTTSDNNGHNNNLHQTVISSVDQPPLHSDTLLHCTKRETSGEHNICVSNSDDSQHAAYLWPASLPDTATIKYLNQWLRKLQSKFSCADIASVQPSSLLVSWASSEHNGGASPKYNMYLLSNFVILDKQYYLSMNINEDFKNITTQMSR